MQNKNLIIGILSLIIVLGIGYAVGGWSNDKDYRNYGPNQGMHMMSDGSMMQNGGGMMGGAFSSNMDMQGMMDSMNAGLRGKTGDDFDKAFLTEMVIHHQGAVQMAELALKNAKHQEIRDLAKAIIVAQNKEIADMQSWEKLWYGR